MDPYDLLVEDCWLHLFQFVSAEDKQALCFTCGAFQAMLEPEKVKWGLELVLPYILKEFDNSYCYRRRRGNNIMKSVLNLRCVCKAWREGFDRFIANGRRYFSLREDIKRKYHFGSDDDEYGWGDNIPTSEKFVAFFKDYSGNPFIGRIVSIYATSSGVDEPHSGNQDGNSENVQGNDEDNEASKDVGVKEEKKLEANGRMEEGESEHEIEEEEDEDGEDDQEEYWHAYEERRRRARRERALKNTEMAMELLSKFGEEIDHLYYGRTYDCTPVEAYKFFQIVLCNCPNLQNLQLFMDDYYDSEEEEDIENDSGFQKWLEEYFEMNPLPKMHGLRELQLCKMNAHVEELMLEACGPNLQKLERKNASEIPVSVWGNMKCLRHLTMINCRFEQMDTLLRAINSPLEALILERIAYDGKEHFKIDNFLLAIQHLPLKDVDVYGGGSLKESAPFPDDFPKHKTISTFSIRVDVFSLNFLQFLPELQSFFVNGAECLWRPLFSK